VTTYTVGIHGDDGSDWYTDTAETQIIYPTDAPSLRPGVNYLLLIRADNGRTSREEGAPDTGFRLLTSEESELIQADTARLQTLALPPEAVAYALAHLYAGHNLIAEAVDLLEKLVEGGSREAAVYRTLGDLYHRIGVERLAEEHYLKASELARQTGDVEGLAVTLASLGEVYVSLGNKGQALAHWQQALQQYEAIGDVAQTAYLQRRIDEMK
jgi:tetratricopeptide (TPR) repeat protein